MDDALFVRGFERLRDLFRDGQRLVEGKTDGSGRTRPTSDQLREVVALDQFHHEGGHAPAFFQPVDGGDVGMIQRREDFRFALKACEPLSILGDRRRQDLDRDLAFQLGVGGPIYLAHPAFADLRGDFVDAEARAGCESQGGVIIRARVERFPIIALLCSLPALSPSTPRTG